jgi:hypothetical protein
MGHREPGTLAFDGVVDFNGTQFDFHAMSPSKGVGLKELSPKVGTAADAAYYQDDAVGFSFVLFAVSEICTADGWAAARILIIQLAGAA